MIFSGKSLLLTLTKFNQEEMHDCSDHVKAGIGIKNLKLRNLKTTSRLYDRHRHEQ